MMLIGAVENKWLLFPKKRGMKTTTCVDKFVSKHILFRAKAKLNFGVFSKHSTLISRGNKLRLPSSRMSPIVGDALMFFVLDH